MTKEWMFRVDPQHKEPTLSFTADNTNLKNWSRVNVPCGFGQCVSGDQRFTGIGWFRKEFKIPEAWSGKRLRLTFDAVNNTATFFLNGHILGESKDPYLPIIFDLRSEVRFGQKNVLAVRVDSKPQGNVPYCGGWYHEGGILRGVRLEEIGDVRFDDLAVVAPAPKADTGEARLYLAISNTCQSRLDSVVRIIISDSHGKTVGTAVTCAQFDPGELTEIAIPVSVPRAVAWSPENPVLYKASALLEIGETIVSENRTRFGFRTVEAKDCRVLLNGVPIHAVGFNRHEDTPETGMARNTAVARQDLQRMKRMGANFLRGSHYPIDTGILDLCDEMGIMVMAEMPVHLTGSNIAEAAHYLACRIRKDRNHPSIIYWSVSNEAQEQDKAVVVENDELIKLARKLDPSRLAVHVSERSRWANPKLQPLFAEDDVICLNGYPSELARIWGKNIHYEFSKAADYWRKVLYEMHERYPDKPIFITEFGYPTDSALRPTVDGAAGAQMQRRAIEAEFAAFEAPYVCGSLIWCWADHPWPKGTYCSDTSPYGIFHRNRRSKGANVEDAIEKMFKERMKSRTAHHE